MPDYNFGLDDEPPVPCGNPGAYCHCGQNCPQGFVWTDDWRDVQGKSCFDTELIKQQQSLLEDCDPVLLAIMFVVVALLAVAGVVALLGLLL